MTGTLFDLIDARSFSNIWYWIALAVLWSWASYWVLGVPFDIIQRAKTDGPQAEKDLEAIATITLGRLIRFQTTSGEWALGGGVFVFTVLGLLAFYYDHELAQAAFLLLFPWALVWVLSVASARRIAAAGTGGQTLVRALMWHRFWVQVIGILAIFVTALFGMYQNLLASLT